MLGGPGHSRLDPSSYKVLQLQRRAPRSAATRKPISKLPFLQSHFECDYSDAQSGRIAQEIERYIKETRNIQKETPAFVEDIRNKIIVLHQYNLNVAQVALTYPLTNSLIQLLLRYLALECKVVYKREHYTKKYEQDVQERIFKLLRTIYYAHFESTVDPPCNVFKECSNAMIDLFIRLKTDYDVTNKIIENIVVALLNKTRNLSKVDDSRGRNPAHSTDADSADVHLIVTSDYGTDDFSPRSEGYDDVTQESDPDLTARRKVIPTICIDDDDKHTVCMEKECAPSERTVRQLREKTSRREREDRVFASHKPIVDSEAVKEEVNSDGARCSFVNSVNKCARSCVDSDSIIVSDDEVEQLLDECAKPLTANATTIDRSNNASFRRGRVAMETENNGQRRSENASETFRVIPTICLEDDGSDTVRFEQECQPSKRTVRQLMAKSARDGRACGAFNAHKPIVHGAPVKDESANDNRDIDICDKSYVNSVNNNVQKPNSLDDDSSSTIDDSDGHDDENELFDDIFLDTDNYDKNVDDSPDTSLAAGRGEAKQNLTRYQINSNRIANCEAKTSNKQVVGTPNNSTNLCLIQKDEQTKRLKTVPIDLTAEDDDNYPKSPKVEADTASNGNDKPAKRIHHEIGIFGDILEYEILSFPKNCHFDLTLDDEADDAHRQSDDQDISHISNELSSLIGNDVQCTRNKGYDKENGEKIDGEAGIRVDHYLGEDLLGCKDSETFNDSLHEEVASAQTTQIPDSQSKSQQVAHKLQTTLAVVGETCGDVHNSPDACKDLESVKSCGSLRDFDELEWSLTDEGVVDKIEDIFADAQEPTDNGNPIETEPTEATVKPSTTEASHDDLVVTSISKELKKPRSETHNTGLLEANCTDDEDNQPTTCKPAIPSCELVVNILPSVETSEPIEKPDKGPSVHQLLAEDLSDEDIGIRQETRLLKDDSTSCDDEAEPKDAVTDQSADVENHLTHENAKAIDQCKSILDQEVHQVTEDRKEVPNPRKVDEELQTTSDTTLQAIEEVEVIEEQLRHAQVLSQDAELLGTSRDNVENSTDKPGGGVEVVTVHHIFDVSESTELEKEAVELEVESNLTRLANTELLDAVDSEEESGHRPVEKIEGLVTSEPVEERLEGVHAETGVLIQDPVLTEESEIEQVFVTTSASEAELSGTSRSEIEYVTEKQSLKILDDVPNQALVTVEDEKDLFEQSEDLEVEKDSSEHYGDHELETIPIPHQRADISGASRNDIEVVTEKDNLKILDDVSSQSPARIEDEKYSSEHPGCHGFETTSMPYDVSNQELAGVENEKDMNEHSGNGQVEKDTFEHSRDHEVEIIPIHHETAELLGAGCNDVQEVTEEDSLKILDDVKSQKLTSIEDQKDFSEHEVATISIVHQRAELLEASVNDVEDVTEKQIDIPYDVSSSQSPAKIEDEIDISQHPGSHETETISIPHTGLIGASCDNMDDVTDQNSLKTVDDVTSQEYAIVEHEKDCAIEKDISEHSQEHEIETILIPHENESLMIVDDEKEVEKDFSEHPGGDELPISLQNVELVGAGYHNIEDVSAKESFNIPDDVEDEKDITEHHGGLEVGNIQISHQNAGLVGAGFDENEDLDEKQDLKIPGDVTSEELVRVEDEKDMFEHSVDLEVGKDIFEHSGDHKVETISIPHQREELLQASCDEIEDISEKEGSRIPVDGSSLEHSEGDKVEIIPISNQEMGLVGANFGGIEEEKDLLEDSGYREVEKDISEHSGSHKVETVSISHQNLELVGAGFDHARDEDEKDMFEHSEDREVEKDTPEHSGCHEVETISLPYESAGLLEANDIEDVTEKESLKILDDVPSQKDTFGHSEDGEVEKQISTHSQDHIVETILIPHTHQLGASCYDTSGIEKEGSVENLQEIQLRDEFTEETEGVIEPNQVTVPEEDIEISQVSSKTLTPEAELLGASPDRAENVTEQLGEGVDVVKQLEAGCIVEDQSTGEYVEVTYLDHAQDVQDQQEAVEVLGNQPNQEIVTISNRSQVEEQSENIHEIPQEPLETSSESLGAIHIDDVKEAQTPEGVVEAMSSSHEIETRPRDPIVIEQVVEIVIGNQSTQATDGIITSKDGREDQLVQKTKATKTIKQIEEFVYDGDNALGEKIDTENIGTTLRSELSKSGDEFGKFHAVVELAGPALSETQKDGAISQDNKPPGGASESPGGETDNTNNVNVDLDSMQEDDDGDKGKNSVGKTLFVKLEQMTEFPSRKKSTPQPSRADSEATVYLFVHHDETNMEQNGQIYGEEQEIVAVANDKFVIDETLIDPPVHLDIDHARPLVYFEDDDLRGDGIAHDLVVHNEEVVTETIFLYSDSYEKPKVDEDVAQPSRSLELVPLPEDNSLVLLANVAASQQLQTPSTSKTGRRRNRQPARKEQQTEGATASRKRKPKQKYVPKAEDLANKRITRSALTRSTTEATETSLPVPHDFLTSSPSFFTGTTDRHYTHKPPDVCSTSEDTNDSEFNNLYIDKEKDTSNELLSLYDEDTLDEVLERRYDVRIQAPMVLSIPDGEVNEYELLDQMERMAAFDGVHGTRQTHGEAVHHVTAETETDDPDPPGVFVPRNIEFTTLFSQVPSRCPTEILSQVAPKPFRTMAQRKEYYKLNPYVSIERLNMKCVESQKVHLRNTRSRSLDINWIRSVKLTDTLTKDDGNFKLDSLPYNEKSARDEIAPKEINIEYPKEVEEIKDGREVAEVPELGTVRENSDDNLPLVSLKVKQHDSSLDEDFDEVPLLERLKVKSELEQSSTQVIDIENATTSQEQVDKTDIIDSTSCQTTSSGPPTEPSLEIEANSSDITKTHVFKANELKKSHSTNNTLNINDMESPNWKYYTAPKLRQKSISKDSLNRLVNIQNEAASSSTKEKLETTTNSIGSTTKTDEKYLLLPKLRRKSLLETTEITKDATKRKPKTVDLLTKCKNTVSPIAEKLKRKLENDKIFQTEGQPLINDITCTPKSTRSSSRESVSEENTTSLELLESPEKAMAVKQIKGPIKKNIGRFFEAENQWLKRTEDNVEEPLTQPIFYKLFGENHETNSNGTQSMISETPKSTKRTKNNKSETIDIVLQNLDHPRPIETDIQDTIKESTQSSDILATSTSNAGSIWTEEVSTETNTDNAICTTEEMNSNQTTNDPTKTSQTPNSSVVSEINVGASATEFTSKESTPTNSKSRRSRAKALSNFAKKINHLSLFHSHLSILNKIGSKRSKNVELRESTISERPSLESNHTGESNIIKSKTKENDASVETAIESVDNVTVPSSNEVNKIASNSKPNNTNKKSLKISDSRRGSRRSRSRSSTTENELEVASKDDCTETQVPKVHTKGGKRKRNELAKSTSFSEHVSSDSIEDMNSISKTEIAEASSQINSSDARAEKSDYSVGAIEHPLKKRPGRPKSNKPPLERNMDVVEDLEVSELQFETANSGVKNNSTPKKRPGRPKSLKPPPKRKINNSFDVFPDLGMNAKASSETHVKNIDKTSISTESPEKNKQASKKRPGRSRSIKLSPERNLDIGLEAQTISEHSSGTCKQTRKENNHNCVKDSESSNISLTTSSTACETAILEVDNSKIKVSVDFTEIQSPKKRPGRPKSVKPSIDEDTTKLEAEPIATDKIPSKVCKQIPKKRLSRSKSAKPLSEENNDGCLAVTTNLEVTVIAGTTCEDKTDSKKRPGRPKSVKPSLESKVVENLEVTKTVEAETIDKYSSETDKQTEKKHPVEVSESAIISVTTSKTACGTASLETKDNNEVKMSVETNIQAPKKRPGRPKSIKPSVEDNANLEAENMFTDEVPPKACKQIPRKRLSRSKSSKLPSEENDDSCLAVATYVSATTLPQLTCEAVYSEADKIGIIPVSAETQEEAPKKRSGRPKSIKRLSEENIDVCAKVVTDLGKTETSDTNSPKTPPEDAASQLEIANECTIPEESVKKPCKKRPGRPKSTKPPLERCIDEYVDMVGNLTELTEESDIILEGINNNGIKISSKSSELCKQIPKKRPGRRKSIKPPLEQNVESCSEASLDIEVADTTSITQIENIDNHIVKMAEDSSEICETTSKKHHDRPKSVKLSLEQNHDDCLGVVDLEVPDLTSPNKTCETIDPENGEGNIKLSADSFAERKKRSGRSKSVKQSLEQNHDDRLGVVEDFGVTVTSDLTSPNKSCETLGLDAANDESDIKLSADSTGACKKRPDRLKPVKISLEQNHDDSLEVVEDLRATVISNPASSNKPCETINSEAENDDIKLSAVSSGERKKRSGRSKSVKQTLEQQNNDDGLRVVEDLLLTVTSDLTFPNKSCEIVNLEAENRDGGNKLSVNSSGERKTCSDQSNCVTLSLEPNHHDHLGVVEDLGVTVTFDLTSPNNPCETVTLDVANDKEDIKPSTYSSEASKKRPGRPKSVKMSLEQNNDDCMRVFDDLGTTVTSDLTSPNNPCETVTLDVANDKDDIKPSTYSSETCKKRPGRPKSVKMSLDQNNDDCMRVVDDLGTTVTSDLTSPSKPDETVDLEAAKDEDDIEVSADSSGACKKRSGPFKYIKISLEPNDDRLKVVDDSGVTVISGLTTSNKPCETVSLDAANDEGDIKLSAHSAGKCKKRPGRPKSVKPSVEPNHDDHLAVVEDLGVAVTSDPTSSNKPCKIPNLEALNDVGDVKLSADSSGACTEPSGGPKSVKLAPVENDDHLRDVDDLEITVTSDLISSNKPCENVNLEADNSESDIKLCTNSSGARKKRLGRPKSVCYQYIDNFEDITSSKKPIRLDVASCDIKTYTGSTRACKKRTGRAKSAKPYLKQKVDICSQGAHELEVKATSDMNCLNKLFETVTLAEDGGDAKISADTSGAHNKGLNEPNSVKPVPKQISDDVLQDSTPDIETVIFNADIHNSDINISILKESSETCKNPPGQPKSIEPYLKENNDNCSEDVDKSEIAITSDSAISNKSAETVTLDAENDDNKKIHSGVSVTCNETLDGSKSIKSLLMQNDKDVKPHQKQNDVNCLDEADELEETIISDSSFSNKPVEAVKLDAKIDEADVKIHLDTFVNQKALGGSKCSKPLLVETVILDIESDAGKAKITVDRPEAYNKDSDWPNSTNPQDADVTGVTSPDTVLETGNDVDDFKTSAKPLKMIDDSEMPVIAGKLLEIVTSEAKIDTEISADSETHGKHFDPHESTKSPPSNININFSQYADELEVTNSSDMAVVEKIPDTVLETGNDVDDFKISAKTLKMIDDSEMPVISDKPLEIVTSEAKNDTEISADSETHGKHFDSHESTKSPPNDININCSQYADGLEVTNSSDMAVVEKIPDTVLETRNDVDDFKISTKTLKMIDDSEMPVIADKLLEIVTSEAKNDTEISADSETRGKHFGQHESTKAPPNDININFSQDSDELEVTNRSDMVVVEKIPVETVILNAVSDDGDDRISAGSTGTCKIPDSIKQHLEQNNDLKVADNSNSDMASPKIPSETKTLGNSSRKKRSPKKRSVGRKSAKPPLPDVDFGADPYSTASKAVNSKSKNIDINNVKLSESTQNIDINVNAISDYASEVCKQIEIIKPPAEETHDNCLETSSNKALVAENINNKKIEVHEESPKELQSQINSDIAKDLAVSTIPDMTSPTTEMISLKSPFENSTIPEENDATVAEAFEKRGATLKKHNNNCQDSSAMSIANIDCDTISISKMNDQPSQENYYNYPNAENCLVTDNAIPESRKNDTLLNGPMEVLNAEITDEQSIHEGAVVEETYSLNRKRKLDTSSSSPQFDDVLMDSSIAKRNKYDEITIDTDLRNQKGSKIHSPLSVSPGRKEKKRLESIINELKENTCIVRPEKHDSLHGLTSKQKLSQKINSTDPDTDRVIESGQDQQLEGCLAEKDAELVSNNPQVLSSDPTSFLSSTDSSDVFNHTSTLPAEPLSTYNDSRNTLLSRLEPSLTLDRKCPVNNISKPKSNTSECETSPNDKIHLKSSTSDGQCSNPSDPTETETDSNEHSMNFGNLVVSSDDGGILSKVITITSADTLLSPTTSTYSFKNDGHIFREPKDPVESADAQVNPDSDLSLDFSDISPIKMFIARDGPLDLISPNNFINDVDYPQSSRDCNHSDVNNEANDDSDHLGGPLLNGKTEDKDLFPSYNQPTNVSNVFPFTFSQLLEVGEYNEINPEEILEILDAKLEPAISHDNEYAAKNLALPAQPTAESNQIGLTNYNLAELECTLIETTDSEDNINCKESDFAPRTDTWSHFFANERSQQKVIVIHNEQYSAPLGNSMEPFAATYTSEIHNRKNTTVFPLEEIKRSKLEGVVTKTKVDNDISSSKISLGNAPLEQPNLSQPKKKPGDKIQSARTNGHMRRNSVVDKPVTKNNDSVLVVPEKPDLTPNTVYYKIKPRTDLLPPRQSQPEKDPIKAVLTSDKLNQNKRPVSPDECLNIFDKIKLYKRGAKKVDAPVNVENVPAKPRARRKPGRPKNLPPDVSEPSQSPKLQIVKPKNTEKNEKYEILNTDNLLKLKMKPINRKQQNATNDSKYSNSYSMDNILKKDQSDHKEANGKHGDNNHEKNGLGVKRAQPPSDHSEPSSSKLRRVEDNHSNNNKDQLFDRLVEQGNLNSVCSLMVTEDNKLKLVRERRPSYSRNNGAPYERRGDTNRWGKHRNEGTSRPYPATYQGHEKKYQDNNVSGSSRGRPQSQYASTSGRFSENSSSSHGWKSYYKPTSVRIGYVSDNKGPFDKSARTMEERLSGTNDLNSDDAWHKKYDHFCPVPQPYTDRNARSSQARVPAKSDNKKEDTWYKKFDRFYPSHHQAYGFDKPHRNESK